MRHGAPPSYLAADVAAAVVVVLVLAVLVKLAAQFPMLRSDLKV